MKCKKCKKEIPAESIYCMWCGVAQKRDKKKTMYQRPDGLFEKSMTLDGQRVTFRGKTEKEVIKKIAGFEGVKEKGRLFDTVAEEWKGEAWERIAQNSKSNYSAAYNRAVGYFKGQDIKAITTDNVRAFLYDRIRDGFAQKTVNTHKIVINQIFELAVTSGDIQFNPVSTIKLPRNMPKTQRVPPTDAEIKKISENVQVDFGLFALFVLYTGCRLGEALAITGADINCKDRTLSISKSICWVGSTPTIKMPKTLSGVRTVPIPDILFNELPKLKKNQYLFGGDSPLKKSAYEKQWYAYKNVTGLSPTPHQLRHGYATLLYEAEVDIKDAQYLLGHSNIAMTMDIYTHLSDSKKAKTMTKFNTFVNKNTHKPCKPA